MCSLIIYDNALFNRIDKNFRNKKNSYLLLSVSIHYILIVFCFKWKSYDAKLAYPSLVSQVVLMVEVWIGYVLMHFKMFNNMDANQK